MRVSTGVSLDAVPLVDYAYGADGQRAVKPTTTTITHYQYGPDGNLIGETDGDTGAVQAEYVWLGGLPLAYIAGGAIHYVHADHLGTPQRVTDGAAAVVWDADYRPFGEATVTGALTFNLRFPGQYYDSVTELHYNGFRDYDSGTGRYVQSDPIGLGGGWNTYAYVGGNPVENIDPNGLWYRVSFSTKNGAVYCEGGRLSYMVSSTAGGCIADCQKKYFEKRIRDIERRHGTGFCKPGGLSNVRATDNAELYPAEIRALGAEIGCLEGKLNSDEPCPSSSPQQEVEVRIRRLREQRDEYITANNNLPPGQQAKETARVEKENPGGLW